MLLDTHIWLRYMGVSGQIRTAAIPLIEAAAEAGLLFVSVISIWEIALLVKQGRLRLQPSVATWAQNAMAQPGINLLPFTPAIAIESVNLTEPMHKDPADRILVASARTENLTLVTRDKEIISFAAGTHLRILKA
jgi:PIN domain nuclease of toxin-antitoxin system